MAIKHNKTGTIADWTQADIDKQIALGNLPPGTTPANMILTSDFNANHVITSDVDFGGFKATNVHDPVSAQDAATKNYVDMHGGVGGSIAATQVAFGSGTNTITGDSNFTYDGTALELASGKLIKGQYSNLAGSAYINPDGSAVFAAGGAIINNAGDVVVAGFKLNTSTASDFVLTSDTVGNGTWQSATNLIQPGGSPTQLQYNNSGLFGGISGSSVNSSTRATGFNQATPLASVHAGTYSQTFPAPSGSTATGAAPSSTGYPFSQGSVIYNAYAAGLINGQTTYSSTYDTFTATAPTVTNYDATSSFSSINYGSGTYTAAGDFFLYQVYALYGSNISLVYTQTNVAADNSGNPFSVAVGWTAPVSAVGLTGYVVVRNWSAIGGDYYVNLGTSTSFNDDGTGWNAGDPSNPPILWNANLSLGTVSGVTNYITYNTATGFWIDTAGTPNFQDNNDFPNPSPLIVTPNSYNYESLISDGTTELVKNGTGSLSFFGATPQTQQIGDMAQALQSYGLVPAPYILASNVQYNNTQPLESGLALYYANGGLLADSGGGLTANTGLYCPVATGVDSLGKATWNGIIDTTLTASTPVFANGSKQLISLNNPLMQQVFGY